MEKCLKTYKQSDLKLVSSRVISIKVNILHVMWSPGKYRNIKHTVFPFFLLIYAFRANAEEQTLE
jgi:hypothetical protein